MFSVVKLHGGNIMISKIGRTAGEIWNYLSEHDEATLSRLSKDLNKTERLISMAIGWLAREEKLQFRQERRAYYISLKKE